MKLILIITHKGKAETLLKEIDKLHGIIAMTFLGKGTASSEILEVLSLAETDKDVLIGFGNDSEIKDIFKKLEDELEFTKRRLGVACTVSLSGITQKTLQHLESTLIVGDK